MEKKTIGALIAALRKAKGMTQRELAEELNVSDKAISRWERDECAPDIMLIPVIADLFGITADELLRGECRGHSENAEDSAWRRERSARQLRHLTESALLKLKEKTLIALGISAGGYVTALLCNFAFNRAELGFFLALLFFGTAVVWEVIHLRRSSPCAWEDFGEEMRESYQNGVTLAGKRFFFGLWMLLGATVPFLYVSAMTSVTPAGLTLFAYLALTLITVLVFRVIWLFADLFVISPRLWEKKLLTVTEKARENVGKRKRILLKTSAVCLSISLLFAVLLGIFVNIHAYTEQIVCHSFEEFKQFIETPMEYRGYERVTMLYEDDLNKDYPVYSFSDENGNVVCE
jgi:transcriptional regulator with XRE-family HTH domain